MNVTDIYTPLRDAEIEIKLRYENLDLKKRLEEFWGENRPEFIYKLGPTCVFSKSLVTPNLEFKYFLDISNDIAINKSLFEYHHGKFVGKNQEKRHLGKMFFYHGSGKRNGNKIDCLNIVDFNNEEGKRLSDVRTLNGKSLIDFHHNLLNERFPNSEFKPVDISEWFNKTRDMDEYYVYYLSLFIRNGILFENFLFDEKEESKFTIEKFMPSFEKVTKMFGVKPLIVPLLPFDYEKKHLWFSHDEDVQKTVKNMLE